jgi:hypothetical protein
MAKKKEVKNSEKELNDGSVEWQNFERGLKQIFSLTPEQAKAIREERVPKEPKRKRRKTN